MVKFETLNYWTLKLLSENRRNYSYVCTMVTLLSSLSSSDSTHALFTRLAHSDPLIDHCIGRIITT